MFFTHEPQSYREVTNDIESEILHAAMVEEMEGQPQHETWKLVPPSAVGEGEQVVVECKWAYRIKPSSTGDPSLCKARLCAKGANRSLVWTTPYTCAPVTRISSVRLFFAHVVVKHIRVRQSGTTDGGRGVGRNLR